MLQEESSDSELDRVEPDEEEVELESEELQLDFVEESDFVQMLLCLFWSALGISKECGDILADSCFEAPSEVFNSLVISLFIEIPASSL